MLKLKAGSASWTWEKKMHFLSHVEASAIGENEPRLLRQFLESVRCPTRREQLTGALCQPWASSGAQMEVQWFSCPLETPETTWQDNSRGSDKPLGEKYTLAGQFKRPPQMR